MRLNNSIAALVKVIREIRKTNSEVGKKLYKFPRKYCNPAEDKQEELLQTSITFLAEY